MIVREDFTRRLTDAANKAQRWCETLRMQSAKAQ